MYVTPKIVASLDAAVVLSSAFGSSNGRSGYGCVP